MKGRSWFVALAAWSVVVVAVSAITWTVIDAAGKDVLGTSTATEPVSSVPAPTTSASTSPSPGATPRADRTPKPRRSIAPSPTANGPTDLPSASFSEVPASPEPASPDPTRTGPANTSGPTSPAPAAVVVRSWQGSAGSVVAACQGARISFRSAAPADGWRMEVDSRGPSRVKVEFERREGDTERKTEVEATCVGGSPRFRAEVDSEVESGD